VGLSLDYQHQGLRYHLEVLAVRVLASFQESFEVFEQLVVKVSAGSFDFLR
jgi:hypothetical protein